MVRKVKWSRSAKTDLQQILEFISRDAPLTAYRIATRIYESSEALSAMPDRGRVIPEFNDQTLREIFVSRYRIMYKVLNGEVLIIAVIHMSRDLQNTLSASED